jgi:hypothetical protein
MIRRGMARLHGTTMASPGAPRHSMRPDEFVDGFAGRNGIRSKNVVGQLRVEVLVPRYRVGDAWPALHDLTSRERPRSRPSHAMWSC